jgi:serine protease AprX
MTLTLSHLAARTRVFVALVAMAAALTAAVLLQGATTSAQSISSSVSAPAPTLSALAASNPTRPVEVIVQFSSKAAFERGRSLLAVNGATVTRDLHIINAYGVRMSAGAAQRLTANPAVHTVSLNSAVKTSSSGSDDVRTTFLESTGADRLWGKRWGDDRWSGTGRGVTVAVIDTGIDGAHADFRTSSRDATNRILASVVTNPEATTEDDQYGHGTHVAGLIAGNGYARPKDDPLRGKYVGAAPNANLVSVKVSNDQGDTSLIDVIYGLQFVVDNKDAYGIRVANLSLSAGETSSYKTDPLDAAVESAWMHGIVVVTAAGNRGTDADAVSYAPGNDPYAISVGAVDTMGTKRTADDALASWSSRGTTEDGFAKPEVLAPGAHMVGPYAPNSTFGTLCPSCVTDGEYFKVGGTSMSAAVVSGLVADLLELHPDWTPDMVKGALVNNLRRMVDGRNEVDLDKASNANRRELVSNQGLTPNELIDPSTGDIDYTRASWSRASWSQVEGDRASWSRASWSRASWSRASWSCDCEVAVTGDADPDRASWSRASWSRASWSRASWSRASWSRASWSASFSK